MYSSIPLELRLMKRWCFTGRDQEPDMQLCKAPHMLVDGYMKAISTVDEYSHCMTFEEIEPLFDMYPDRDFGFILVDGDGFTCIDLDVKDDSPVSLTERHATLIESMDTYTEASQSGCGVHMWIKGEIDGAIKTTEMEVYSRERFIICTGNALHDIPMAYDTEVIAWFNRHASKQVDYDAVENKAQKKDDKDVLSDILEGDHTGKFKALYHGNWDDYLEILCGQRDAAMEFNPSDADAAFMTIVTFFTQNFDQCKRIWRSSALADVNKRYRGNEKEARRKAKNTGTDYKLNRVISLGIQRNAKDKAYQDKLSAEGAVQAQAVLAQLKEQQETKARLEELNASTVGDGLPPELSLNRNARTTFPPGKLGELAKQFKSISIKPIDEFAIIEALAVASGLFGRSYNVSGTGLNNYFMMIAPSGSGKSALSKNPEWFFNYFAREKGIVDARKFVTTKRYTHENAMFKEFAERSCFVQCLSEFGKTFRNMVANSNNNVSALATVREAMTDIYPKSGFNDTAGGVRYTDSEKSVDIQHPVAYSFLGESVAEPFYESITPDMFSDGFISRFMILQFEGTVPYDSPFNNTEMSSDLSDYFEQAIIGTLRSLADINSVNVTPVGKTPEVGAWFTGFNKLCTDKINAHEGNAVECSLWNRCNLKVMKLAALLAVTDNYINPIITMEHLTWAYDFVARHNDLIRNLVKMGTIGDNSSGGRSRIIHEFMANFMSTSINPDKGLYNIKHAHNLQQQGIIPARVLLINCRQKSCFKDQFKPVPQLLAEGLRELEMAGYIRKVPKDEALTKYNYRAECYQILELE